MEKIIFKCQSLLSHSQTTALKLTTLIGVMFSTAKAVLPASLRLRYLQQQIQSLNQACSCQVEIALSSLSKQELLWWVENLKLKKWKITKVKAIKFNHTNRCIKIRLESLLQQCINWGEMVRKGGKFAYKCSEVNSRKVWDFNIHKRTIKYSNSFVDRQEDWTFENGCTHNRELLHIGKSIWSYLLSKQIAMSTKYLPSVLNVNADWESRNAKDNLEWKLDVSRFQEIATFMRQPTLDLFASRLCYQLPRYIAWKPDMGSIAINAFWHPWDKEYGFDFPPFSFIRRKNTPSNHSDTHMTNSALVCTTFKNVYTATFSFALERKFINKSTGQKSSSARNKVTEVSSVEGLQESLQMGGISSNTAKLISHSRIKNSTTNYESAWDQWAGWCNKRQINSFQAPVNYLKNLIKSYNIEPWIY